MKLGTSNLIHDHSVSIAITTIKALYKSSSFTFTFRPNWKMLTNFKNSLTAGLCNKFAARLLLYYLSYLKYVTTLRPRSTFIKLLCIVDNWTGSCVVDIPTLSVYIVCLFVCFSLSVCLSACLFLSVSVCLSVYLSVCLSVCLSVSQCVCVSVCLCAGLMYDVTGSYTVGFVTLICVSLVALSLMLAICVIDHLTKKVTESNSMAIVVQSQATDTKCWPVNITIG